MPHLRSAIGGVLLAAALAAPARAETSTFDFYIAGIKAGEVTLDRLQSTADTQLKAYIAQGEVLDAPTESFGSIGIFAIPEMNRFYRHVLIQKHFPHHAAIAFGHYGKAFYEIFKYLGIADISYNQPKELPYPTENPFA